MLLQKNKAKGNIASNYRPITCLPLVWKFLTGVLADLSLFRKQNVVARETKRM